MKQLKLDNTAEQFVTKDKLEKYIKNSLVIVVIKKVKTVYILKTGGLRDYIVYKDDVVNGSCTYDSLFQYYNVYLFGTNRSIKLTNVNNNDVYDEFRAAAESDKKIVIGKSIMEKKSYIIEPSKHLDDVYFVKALNGHDGTNASVEWIFENLDVFVLDV